MTHIFLMVKHTEGNTFQEKLSIAQAGNWHEVVQSRKNTILNGN